MMTSSDNPIADEVFRAPIHRRSAAFIGKLANFASGSQDFPLQLLADFGQAPRRSLEARQTSPAPSVATIHNRDHRERQGLRRFGLLLSGGGDGALNGVSVFFAASPTRFTRTGTGRCLQPQKVLCITREAFRLLQDFQRRSQRLAEMSPQHSGRQALPAAGPLRRPTTLAARRRHAGAETVWGSRRARRAYTWSSDGSADLMEGIAGFVSRQLTVSVGNTSAPKPASGAAGQPSEASNNSTLTGRPAPTPARRQLPVKHFTPRPCGRRLPGR